MFKKIKEEKANSSLFFLILLPVTMLILFATFANGQSRRNELDFVRASENNLDLTLADYDRQLWQEFGLWGVNEEALNQYSDELLGQYMKEEYLVANKIYPANYLEETDQFRTQILRHMNIRSKIFLIEEILNRFTDFQSLSTSLNNSEFWSNLKQDNIDPEKLLQNPDLAQAKLTDLNLTEDQFQEEREDKTEEERSALKEASLSILANLIDQAKEMLIPIYESIGNEQPSDPLSPSSLESIGDFVDNLMSRHNTTFSRLEINEYMFHYYTMQCSEFYQHGIPQKMKTPDGRLHEDLIKNGRECEVEHIIFEKNSPQASAKTAKTAITAIRFLYHFMNNTVDPVKQSAYLTQATEISLIIAIASLGDIAIDPQILAQILVLIDSLSSTFKDMDKVMEGHYLTFKIFELETKMNYLDFLRIFALLKSEEKILESMTETRQKLIPGKFATAFILEGTFEDSFLRLKREFSDYLFESENLIE